jgi:hypothetical protein
MIDMGQADRTLRAAPSAPDEGVFKRFKERMDKMKLEAVQLRNGEWCVRPQGQLGTCGWHPKAWTAQFVRAASADAAVRKVTLQGGLK